MNRQFVLFLFAGGVAACVNFFSRMLLSLWLVYGAAIVVAYVLGMITAFALNRALVFRRVSHSMRHQVFWFTVVNLAAVLQTLAISLLLAEWLFPRMGLTWHPETVAHAFGVAVPVVTSFIGHKYLSFKSH
ncbi:Putative flippase GtrA (transmembrane translocase of bactoprenol-linked glucose) [Dyella jiangningensis]|uniref:GtrA family protein n=1 Tax=Dyella sp. AtDHG13 TaxID=1938897 RepID=UPI00088FFCDD|nr:GtrA family protein [Dyella sp. AtDHG13]PXV57256.1 putative flippase GtrA [Dyella sp. AtDHG13]SDK37232.1 Putative flippase GtrA (transmembrane translocase of bactoprenol-linked glucose) [Dyella jiangningensis]